MEARPMDEVLKKVAAICPAAVQDNKIDFERLKQELAPELIEDAESYNFTWVGKKDAIMGASTPIRKTLRPCKEESKNWDTTKNLYIEGDNLDVLKLLQESYLGKVKMIYIDPPYNTGNDFVYCDDFSMNCEEYMDKKGQCDVETNERLFKNDESNGRYHSNWCSMIYPRLKVVRDLLADDGVIFISIDDHEIANLRKICDEVFGEDKFVGTFKWNKTSKAPTLSKKIRGKYEYVLCYEKKDVFVLRGPDSYNTMAPLLNGSNPMSTLAFLPGELTLLFEDGTYSANTYETSNGSVILHNDIIVKDNKNVNAVEISAKFKWTQQTLKERMAKGQNIVIKTPKFATVYYTLLEDEDKFIAPSDILNKEECEVLRNDEGCNELKTLFDGNSVFDYVKPVSLIKYLTRMQTSTDFIVLDFFAGSSTTAQAVMQLNAEDGGKRRFIMVQLPELCDEKSEAFKAGYKNICEIGKERIRRAGDKIVADTGKSGLDIGFKVLKLDDTNMKDVYYTPMDTTQSGLLDSVDNIKEDRSELDLLYGVMLDLGLQLDLDVKETKSGNTTYYNVDDGSLIACFNQNIPDSIIKEIAELKPFKVVFRDSSFPDAPAKINVTEIFKTISPNTKITVL